MNVSFEEIGAVAVTFAQEGCAAGQVCKVTDQSKVGPCTAGEKFCGIVEGIRGDYAAVQVAGFVQVGFTGTMSLGYVNLCADGNGGVKEGQGREHLVVSVNEAAATAVIKL